MSTVSIGAGVVIEATAAAVAAAVRAVRSMLEVVTAGVPSER